MLPIILIVGFEKKGLARLTLLIQKCLKTIKSTYFLKFFSPLATFSTSSELGTNVMPPGSIDLFCLYVLFSQYRSRYDTLGNCSFKISPCSRAYLRINYEKTKG